MKLRVALFLAAAAAVVLSLDEPTRAQRRAPSIAVPAAVVNQAQTGGARVIVRLRTPFIAEALIDPAIEASQTIGIRLVGDRVIARVQAAGRLRNLKQYEHTPYLAAEVDAATLDALASDPDVESIVDDKFTPLALAESGPLVGRPQAALRGYTGSGYTVAVLDTGVDKAHTYLSGRVVSEACYSANLCPGGGTSSTAPGSGVPCTVSTNCGHGTHVAGIVASQHSTQSGIARGATLIAIQVFSYSGGLGAYDSDIGAGLDRVYTLRTTFNVASVNLSLGDGTPRASACDSYGAFLKTFIDQLRAANIATVIATGNEGSSTGISYPACISSSVSVGSVDDGSFGTVARAVSDFSNSSANMTFWAPGRWITSTVPGGTNMDTYSGTSMATPHVAAAWAVVRQRRPAATVDAVLSLLARTGRSITDPRNGVTKPLVDLDAATADTCALTLSPTSRSVNASATSGTIAVTTPADCGMWTATSNASWLTITGGGSGTGNGTIAYSVAANFSSSQRSGTISVNGQSFVLIQAGNVVLIDDRPGFPTLIWHNTSSGALEAWAMNGATLDSIIPLSPSSMTEAGWNLAGAVDFDRDGRRDLLWQNLEDGRVTIWLMNGPSRTSVVSLPTVPDVNWQIAAIADLDLDGNQDLVWHHQTLGYIRIWFMNGTSRLREVTPDPPRVRDTNWKIVGAYDANVDGVPDLIWYHLTEGLIYVSIMDGSSNVVQTQSDFLTPNRVDANWRLVGVTDVDGDFRSDDFIWQHRTTGALYVWRMQGRVMVQELPMNPDARSAGWRLPGARYPTITQRSDFNGDGWPDLIVRQDSGQIQAWLMAGLALQSRISIGDPVSSSWKIVASADFNLDGFADIIWQHDDGWLSAWLMRNGRVMDIVALDPSQEPDSSWRVVGTYDANRDGRPDLLWQHTYGGQLRVWYMDGLTRTSTGAFLRDRSNDPFWRVAGIGDVNGDGRDDILWWHSLEGYSGAWYMDDRTVTDEATFVDQGRTPIRMNLSWRTVGVGDFNHDGFPDLVWQNIDPSTPYLRWVQVWYMFGGTLVSSEFISPASTGDGRVTAVR